MSDDNAELVRRMTAAMREADRGFEKVGGSTRHHVRDHLLPVLAGHKLVLLTSEDAAWAAEFVRGYAAQLLAGSDLRRNLEALAGRLGGAT